MDTMRTLRYANADTSMATVFGTLVSGAYLMMFVRGLTKDYLWIGLLTAIPSLVGLLQIPGAIWGRSFPFYRKFISPGGVIWRLCYIPLVAAPLLPISTDYKLYLVLVLIFFASVSIQIVSPIYNDWLAELVPQGSRGWFFSRRQMLLSLSGAVSGLAAGAIYDYFKRANQSDTGFAVVYAIGVIFGLLSLIPFYKMKEIERSNPIEMNMTEGLRAMKAPFKDRGFIKVLKFFVVFIFATSFAGNVFSIYALEQLKMDMTMLQTTGICHSIGSLATLKLWGYFGDKYGNKPVMSLLLCGIAFTPLPWLLCIPGNHVFNVAILGVTHIIAGACWGGIAVLQFNLLLATASEDDRANYIGAGLALQAVVGAIAPFLGGIAVQALKEPIGDLNACRWVIGITAVLRTISIAFLAPVHEPGSTSVKQALSSMKRISPLGFKALKQMNSPENSIARTAAIASVGDANFDVAREEVIRALQDPSPRVRRQASATLARLGGKDAADALLNRLKQQPDLVEEEMLEAIGDIGFEQSIGELCRHLASPRPSIRRASIKAIGSIGGEMATAHLMKSIDQDADPDLRRAALQALQSDQEGDYCEVVSKALLDVLPSVRIAAAEAIVELKIAGIEPALLASLDTYDDAGSSEVAYALGRIGGEKYLEKILDASKNSLSSMTRRRCLLGAAAALNQESKVYQLFLLDDFSRGAKLLETLAPSLRKIEGLSESLNLFTSGQEEEAIEYLALEYGGAVSQAFLRHGGKERFLIYVLFVEKTALMNLS